MLTDHRLRELLSQLKVGKEVMRHRAYRDRLFRIQWLDVKGG